MIFRSKAPLRIGFAGGGTDVSPYSDQFGGAILNATINLYAYASIEELGEGKIIMETMDRGEVFVSNWKDELEVDGYLSLHKGVHNRLVRDGHLNGHGYKLTTYVDAPAGSGLGTSSTLMTTILGAYQEWLNLPFGEYDTAHLAYEIERSDLGMAGGKQDQYSATFGGFNFMEFYNEDKVIVNPFRIKEKYANELAHNLILLYTQTSRESAAIIEMQRKNVNANNEQALEAMHQLKKQAVLMKEALLKGDMDHIGEILRFGWDNKKRMAEGITNPMIDDLYRTAMKNGASGGKISGAGGGGFMMFYCPRNSRHDVVKALEEKGAKNQLYQFSKEGLSTWKV